VKSKRIRVEEGDAPEEEGAKRHSRADFRAAAPKNWLGAGLPSSAEETEPSGLICTRTFTRTVPRMLERAFEEMSGTTLWTIVGADEFATVDNEGDGEVDGFALDGAPEETELEPELFSVDAELLPVREGGFAEAAPEFGAGEIAEDDFLDDAAGAVAAGLDLLPGAKFVGAELA
jgi:hypothetical protein